LLYEHIANQRKDFLHKVTTRLIRENQTICIEDLNVKGMMKNRKLSKHIGDAGWGMFFQFLRYKSDWYGSNIMTIGRFEPSSKTCSKCGYIKHDLTLTDRTWICPTCGENHDRDVNAALNLKYFGEYVLDLSVSSTTVSSTGCNACGGERFQFLTEQCSSMKQEFKSIKLAHASFNQIC
jgi:IS605 OrfB family transposase